MKRISFKFLALALALTLYSCNSKPKAGLVKDQLDLKVFAESEAHIELIDFEKTDGRELEIFGIKGYEMNFECKIRYKKKCYKQFLRGLTNLYSDFYVSIEDPERSNRMDIVPRTTVEFAEGEKALLKGTAYLQKKESGWKCGEIKINEAKPIAQ